MSEERFPIRNICDVIVKDLQGNYYDINMLCCNGNDEIIIEIKKPNEEYRDKWEDCMGEKQFVVKELEILNEENDWKGEYWWAVVNTQRVEDCFECRNKEVALKLCDFLNKATNDFKWQINQCEKLSAKVKQLKKENEQLRQTIKEMQQDEQLYANEILELREANKEFIQFKDLGGDY